MQHPLGPAEGLYLVHRVMVQQQMQRNNPELHQYVREHPRNRVGLAMRQAIGRGLIALGTRLDPGARRAEPAGDIAIAGGTRG